MVTVGKPLIELKRDHCLREDLYYLLSGLELKVPPLRDRKEDLEQKIDETLRDCCERYARYHVLTRGAKEILMKYAWPGNLFQIESYFERLILTAGKRSVDEIAVRKLLETLYPQERELCPQNGHPEDWTKPGGSSGIRSSRLVISEEEEAIRNSLIRYGGSREKTAKVLGISKATLWRKMKKYGIED